ncbi:hypothetical protein [Chitinophaga japonensis]|uniref:Uncharacterized protein n=1 Tax=Chitinophaga japonensis TaxID=104662 RepID=A0A562SZ21_CHIJA|nr:hypothetical protein [Chitinophaga japonensis]TWI86559.1 hypothetical protein LX66_3818 [Chitinophaga japonensis]
MKAVTALIHERSAAKAQNNRYIESFPAFSELATRKILLGNGVAKEIRDDGELVALGYLPG